jgi:biotin carboxyl carrier protein
MKHLKITVEGRTFDVTAAFAEDYPAEPEKKEATTAKLDTHTESHVVKSPISGRLISYDVTEGELVVAGQQVAVVESMKMNTFIQTQAEGTVSRLLCKLGEGVEEGDDLMEIRIAT